MASRASQHVWETILLLLVTFSLMNCFTLRLYCDDDTSLSSYIEVLPIEAPKLLSSECYNNTRRTIFWIFGFGGNDTGPASSTVLPAFISTFEYNVILCNWHTEASAITITPQVDPITKIVSYITTGLAGALYVGTHLGLVVVEMARFGLNLAWVLLLGHSLGAQVAGQAGRTVIANYGQPVGKILGLDPAGKFWGNPPNLPSLRKSDAEHVCVVHCDPGGYAINESLADVDIYGNFLAFVGSNPSLQVQPGCPEGQFPFFTPEDFCSHNMCWRWLAWAVRNPNTVNSLLGSKADNVYDWLEGLGDCSDTAQITDDWDIMSSGVYFLNTSAVSPYGLGVAGSCPGA